jgi:hypothetical protein
MLSFKERWFICLRKRKGEGVFCAFLLPSQAEACGYNLRLPQPF